MSSSRRKNNGNILKKANIEISKQRLARMGLRQRSGNKTEKNHQKEISKLRLARMGLRERSQNKSKKSEYLLEIILILDTGEKLLQKQKKILFLFTKKPYEIH